MCSRCAPYAFRLIAMIEKNPFSRNSHTDALDLYNLNIILAAPYNKLHKTIFCFDNEVLIVITRNLNDFCRKLKWADAAFFTDVSVKTMRSGIAIFDLQWSTENSVCVSLTIYRTCLKNIFDIA